MVKVQVASILLKSGIVVLVGRPTRWSSSSCLLGHLSYQQSDGVQQCTTLVIILTSIITSSHCGLWGWVGCPRGWCTMPIPYASMQMTRFAFHHTMIISCNCILKRGLTILFLENTNHILNYYRWAFKNRIIWDVPTFLTDQGIKIKGWWWHWTFLTPPIGSILSDCPSKGYILSAYTHIYRCLNWLDYLCLVHLIFTRLGTFLHSEAYSKQSWFLLAGWNII